MTPCPDSWRDRVDCWVLVVMSVGLVGLIWLALWLARR